MIESQPLVLKVGEIPMGFRIRVRGADLKVHVRTPRQYELSLLMPEKLPPDTSKFLLCPMPGLIVKISVEEGDEVQEGQALATVEAMKMENVLRAERQSVVKKVNVAPRITSYNVCYTKLLRLLRSDRRCIIRTP